MPVGLMPLAVCGRFPIGAGVEDSVTTFARRIVERVTKEASPKRMVRSAAKAASWQEISETL